MTRDSATIIVRVIPTGSRFKEIADPKDEFWRHVQTRSSQFTKQEFQPDDFERLIVRNLGKQIKKHLTEYVDPFRRFDPSAGPSSPPAKANVKDKLIGIFFGARILGYASLSLGIDIEGLKRLVELFDNNFSLFAMFFNAYLPAAFEDTFDLRNQTPPFDYEMDFSELEGSFAARQSGPRPLGEILHDPEARAKWMWGIANFSLVVPVLLALLVLYVSLNWTAEEHARFTVRTEKVLAAQDALIKAYQDHLVNTMGLGQTRGEKQPADSTTGRRQITSVGQYQEH